MTLCTKTEAVKEISKTINSLASQQTLVLLSGGSSASVGVEALSKIDMVFRKNIIVMLADERFVDYNSSDSNGNLIRELGVSIYCSKFIETIHENSGTLEDTVDLFRKNISNSINQSKHVVAIFGVGSDNHIAGILPNSLATNSKDLFAVGYHTDRFPRITISPRSFNNITNAYVYAEGNDKQKAIDAIESDKNYKSYPSQLIKQTGAWNVLFNKEKL